MQYQNYTYKPLQYHYLNKKTNTPLRYLIYEGKPTTNSRYRDLQPRVQHLPHCAHLQRLDIRPALLATKEETQAHPEASLRIHHPQQQPAEQVDDKIDELVLNWINSFYFEIRQHSLHKLRAHRCILQNRYLPLLQVFLQPIPFSQLHLSLHLSFQSFSHFYFLLLL